MAGPLIECVPNFSEGRDAATVRAIQQAIESVAGVILLRAEMDEDHNRSVITFAGPPEAVADAAFCGIAEAVKRIDLRRHSGVHPRIGAADVVPFVPLEGVGIQDCVDIAHATGKRVWESLGVPVYFYEAAARGPERVPLENCRRGGFENPALSPDLGGPQLHPSAGACVIGARKLLIAFNVNLNTQDVGVAHAIARKIRGASGGLPFLKAIGRPLASRKMVQVAMNLTDFERTPLHDVFDSVRGEAAARNVSIAGSQIVGLVPRRAMEQAAAHYLQCEHFEANLILENRLAIEPLFQDLARRQSPKGGGSAAAAAGAMAAALGSKLCAFLAVPGCFDNALNFFSAAIERDAAAFQSANLESAATVPIEVAEQAGLLIESLSAMQVPEKFASDLESALALARAAVAGAAATARANLIQLPDSIVKSILEKRLIHVGQVGNLPPIGNRPV
ncbi:MAG TPA: glutamate formimidoyltransferase, partial [Bryobacteraceae bacterium]